MVKLNVHVHQTRKSTSSCSSCAHAQDPDSLLSTVAKGERARLSLKGAGVAQPLGIVFHHHLVDNATAADQEAQRVLLGDPDDKDCDGVPDERDEVCEYRISGTVRAFTVTLYMPSI